MSSLPSEGLASGVERRNGCKLSFSQVGYFISQLLNDRQRSSKVVSHLLKDRHVLLVTHARIKQLARSRDILLAHKPVPIRRNCFNTLANRSHSLASTFDLHQRTNECHN